MHWKIERDPYYKQLYALTKDTAGDAASNTVNKRCCANLLKQFV